jgi:hypothetical protein
MTVSVFLEEFFCFPRRKLSYSATGEYRIVRKADNSGNVGSFQVSGEGPEGDMTVFEKGLDSPLKNPRDASSSISDDLSNVGE